MSDTIISVKNVSKSYPIYEKPSDLLLEVITRKCRHDLFWALRDVSFDVLHGKRIGIIGPNGAGKSTLLKMLTGNTTPTTGTIDINGKVSAMLSLTFFLKPEETGLNNIKLNLLLNGCNKKDIPRLTEEIIEFTELGPFIYSPVKTYSSGMNARLAFAITTEMQPEILVVDEVLSVGDGYFVGKAIKRMIDLCNRGKALIFVSHSIADVKKLCDTVIWLENGSVRKIGPASEICSEYEEHVIKKRDATERDVNNKKQAKARFNANKSDLSDRTICQMRIVAGERGSNFKDVHYIRDIKVCSDAGSPVAVPIEMGEINENTPARLDVLDTEWGRLYNRHGYDSRLLSANTGKSAGGGICYRIDSTLTTKHSIPFLCSFMVNSHSGTEALAFEYLDNKDAEWKRVTNLTVTKVDRDWNQMVARFEMPLASEVEFMRATELVHQQTRPDVEILSATITSAGEKVCSIKERQPFCITVRVQANCIVPCADVTINIYKSDGTYVFFQSSALNPENIYDTSRNFYNLEGEVKVMFHFDVNLFNAGQYEVNAFCANGIDVVNNLPQTEQYAAVFGIAKFLIIKEFDTDYISFGQINSYIRVSDNRSST